MAYFLAKTDPETYTLDQLEKDGSTVWDGVKNAQALQAIRTMKKGDKVFVYHSGGVSAVVGMAKVTEGPRPDPKDEKSWVVNLGFVSRLPQPVTLTEVKKSGLFNDWNLVRNSRLSTMAAPEAFAEWMRAKFPKSKI